MGNWTEMEKNLIVMAAAETARIARTDYYKFDGERITGNSTTGNNDFDDVRVEHGEVIIFTNICAGTDDVDTTRVDFGTWDGFKFRRFYSASQGTDSVLVSWQGQIILMEGEALRVRIYKTAAATDKLEWFAQGYRLKQ